MPTMADVRAKFPQYDDMDDATLASALHRKYYSDIPKAEFEAKIGLSTAPAEKKPGPHGKADAAAAGALDTLSFGTIDELGAGAAYLINQLPGGDGASYDDILAKTRGELTQAQEDNPGSYFAGQLAGGIGQGAGLLRAGLSAAANTARAGGSLGRIATSSAIDASAAGAAHGFGSGEGFENRLYNAGVGAATGSALGIAAPYAIAGVAAASRPLLAPVMARVRPESYANDALAEGLKRSGKSIDELSEDLRLAQADGQDMFTMADAMGNSGQRLMSTVARTPNMERQNVVRGLVERQTAQGGRVAGALEDASGSRLTAAQYEEALKAHRSADADINYAPVSSDISPIDVNSTVALANRSISPMADIVATRQGRVPTDLAARRGIEAGEAAIRDPIREAVREARAYLAADTLTGVNVEKAFRAKTNIDAMIANAAENNRGGVVAELTPIRDELDETLARTSTQYASARDAYRTASGRVDAVQTGREMARPRNRADDNLETYALLPDDEARRAASVGYFDPKISKAEGQAGQLTNSARPLISAQTRKEFPVFAAPGRVDQLNRRLAREQTMFETNAAGFGGSKTADNLADAADLAQYDPTILTTLLKRGPVDAVVQAVTKVMMEGKGMPPAVVERVAKALMETRPEVVQKIMTDAMRKDAAGTERRAVANALIGAISGSAAGRMSAP